MTESTPSRHRLMIDVKPEVRERVHADADQEGISVNDLVQKSLRIRSALHQLSQTGVNIVLRDKAGEQVLEMPATVFETFLESDPALIDYFIRQNPKSQ